jgi:hypothetical protein
MEKELSLKSLTREVPKLTDWENEPSVEDLKKDYREAQSSHSAQCQKIDRWLDNLNVTGSAKIKKVKGRSNIVPKLIRKQAEWRYAALSEPFLNTPNLFKAEPVSWDDRKAAQQNELILNNQFTTKIDKNRFIDQYVRAAVNEGTVIVRIGWEFEEVEQDVEVPVTKLVPIPPNNVMPFPVSTGAPGLPELLSALGQGVGTPPPGAMPPGPGSPTSLSPPGMPGELPGPPVGSPEGVMGIGSKPFGPQDLTEVVVGMALEKQLVVVKNHPTVEVCNYENVILDPTCIGNQDKANFIIYRYETSLSELKKSGRYQNLDKINIESSSLLAEPDAHMSDDARNFKFADEPRKKFMAYEYWGFWDIENTGKTKAIVATWVGDTMIQLEESPFPDGKLPFVIVQYLPVKNSLYGEPDGELLEDNQKVVGAVTRGMVDIMGRSANGQIGIRQDALDVTNRRKFEMGMDYDFNAHIDPRTAIFTHTYPEIPQSAQVMLQMQNAEAEALTGVKAFSGGLSGDALGQTATGVRGVLDAASKRELGILRRLAEGMKSIGRKIIAMNGVFLSDQEVVRVTNDKFVTVQRDDLYGNFDIKLEISTAESDNAKAQELAFMLQTMGNNMLPDMSKMILSEIARLRNMPDLAKRIEEFQPQPDPMVQQKAQLELALLQAKIQNLQAQASMAGTSSMLNEAKAGTEEVRARYLGNEADMLDLDFVEQESGVKQERDLERQGAQAEANMRMKEAEQRMRLALESMKPRKPSYR